MSTLINGSQGAKKVKWDKAETKISTLNCFSRTYNFNN